MSDFYMLAGTVLSHKTLHELHTLLADNAIASRILDDELQINGQSTLCFRTGFDHEYILVGDAIESSNLYADIRRLSSVLQQQKIHHAYEIYDRDNQQIFDYEYQIE